MVVEHGFPGTYWLMGPDGVRLPSLINETHLKPWISSVGNDEDLELEDNSGSENIGSLQDDNAARSAAVEVEDSDKIHKGSSSERPQE